MLNAVLVILKSAVLALYALTVAAQVWPPLQDFREPLLWVTGFLAIAHLGEYLFVKKRLDNADPYVRTHFINTLLFGFLHWLPILKAVKTTKT